MSRKKSDINRFKEKHLAIYKSWKKIYCPALEADVHFTNKGWNHLQQEKWRSKQEKESRLLLLGTAKHILGKATFFQSRRLQPYHGTQHDHIGFRAVVGGALVGVVVIEDKGQFDFLSVFRV